MTVNAAKFGGYAILEPLGVFDSKLSGYSILEPKNANVTKLSGYAILQSLPQPPFGWFVQTQNLLRHPIAFVLDQRFVFEPPLQPPFGWFAPPQPLLKHSITSVWEQPFALLLLPSIAQWRDKSPNHFVLSQSGSTRPSLVMNSLNGLPLVQFDAANSQVLNFDRSLDLSGGYTYVGVLVRGDGISSSSVETLGNTSGPIPDAIEWQYQTGFNSGLAYIHNEIGYGKTLTFTMCRDAIVLSAIVSSSNNVQLFINGVDTTDPSGMTILSNPDGTFNIFGYGDGTFTNGYFGEQKFWRGVLSPADLASETTAMMNKWGITVC